MKKSKSPSDGALHREYKRGDFPNGLTQGKYSKRLASQSNIVRLKPRIAAAFPTREAVNAALAAVLRKGKAERTVSRSGVRTREK